MKQFNNWRKYRAIVIGAQGEIRLQISANVESGRRHSWQQSVFSIWQRLEPAIQNRDAGELSVRVAYEADDTETPRGMRSGDIL